MKVQRLNKYHYLVSYHKTWHSSDKFAFMYIYRAPDDNS